jgi:hypothetical protein
LTPQPTGQHDVEMTDIGYFSMMRSNVAASEGHVLKQHEIIERLTAQGHTAMADQARDLLTTMNGHLRTETDMLARLEAKALAPP